MKNTLIDRITIGFYEEVLDDMILKAIFDRQCTAKYRGQKIKEVLMLYFREHNADLVARIEFELTNKNTVEPTTSTNTMVQEEILENPKKKKLKEIREW